MMMGERDSEDWGLGSLDWLAF